MERQFVPEYVQQNMMEYYKNGVPSLFEHGVEMQRCVLEDIIALGCNSQYAKDKGFDGITSREEFMKKVPLSDYGDYVGVHRQLVLDEHAICYTTAYIEEWMFNEPGMVKKTFDYPTFPIQHMILKKTNADNEAVGILEDIIVQTVF